MIVRDLPAANHEVMRQHAAHRLGEAASDAFFGHGERLPCFGVPGAHFLDEALKELRAGNTKTWEKFDVPKDAIGCGFTEAVRGVLSHHMVIRDGKIANYHPYPPTPWNGSVRDVYGTPGPYEDAVQNTPIFEENSKDNFKGIDIMRAVRSFDPCLPCGVHMYLGDGKVLKTAHSPTGVTLAM